ncbi:MAG: sulfotransferase, partial [Planctomycetota bacterium]|nr:sulfotransferase [Planctomycetota bacterium]
YEQSTTDLEIPRWGIKSPIGSIESHLLIAELLPRAQHLYIYRHPEAVLRSQKARNWLPTLKDIQRQSEKWANHLNYIFQIQDRPNHLVLRYEELLANQEAGAKRICNFLKISSVDMNIFDKKINTFSGPNELGYSPTGYIAPKPLTPEEFEAMVEIVKPLADTIDYSLEREND